jgi:hypothetical protein
MGADEVLLQRFVGGWRQPGGLGQHPGLQRQQVAEDARQRHHHVDARAAEFLSGIRSAPAQPAIAVEARRAPISASAWAIGPPSDLMLSDPQSTSATERGRSDGVSSSSCAWRAVRQAKAVGMRNGSKAWMLRPVGRISGERIRSPPGTGRM